MPRAQHKPENDASIGQAQIRMLRCALLTQGAGNIGWAMIVGCAFFFSRDLGPLPTSKILLWAASLTFSGITSLTAGLSFLPYVSGDRAEQRTLRKITAVVSLRSAAWCLLPSLLWVQNNSFNNYSIIITLVGMCSTNFQLFPHRPTYFIGTLPPIFAVLARIIFSHSTYLLPATFITPAYLTWCAILSSQSNKVMLSGVKAKLHNKMLMEDLRAARDEALQQKAAAVSANRAKSKFLTNISHELRTPLNAIIGFSEVIENQLFGVGASRKYREYASDIHKSGRHLLGLINEILDLAKIESGKFTLQKHEVEINSILRSCLRLITPDAEKKGIVLAYESSSPNVQVFLDESVMRQIMLNLLSNAVKFTEQGKIVLSLASLDDVAEISVCDTGCGIAPEYLAKIFEPFERVDNSYIRKEVGTGLGLAIAAKLIEMQGGSCRVASTVGKGTTFSISLPYSISRDSSVAA